MPGTSRDKELSDLQFVLQDARGRAVLGRMLDRLRGHVAGDPYRPRTVFRPVGGIAAEHWPYYNGAWLDFAQWVYEEVIAADPSCRLLDLMNREGLNRAVMAETKNQDKAAEEKEDNGE